MKNLQIQKYKKALRSFFLIASIIYLPTNMATATEKRQYTALEMSVSGMNTSGDSVNLTLGIGGGYKSDNKFSGLSAKEAIDYIKTAKKELLFTVMANEQEVGTLILTGHAKSKADSDNVLSITSSQPLDEKQKQQIQKFTQYFESNNSLATLYVRPPYTEGNPQCQAADLFAKEGIEIEPIKGTKNVRVTLKGIPKEVYDEKFEGVCKENKHKKSRATFSVPNKQGSTKNVAMILTNAEYSSKLNGISFEGTIIGDSIEINEPVTLWISGRK